MPNHTDNPDDAASSHKELKELLTMRSSIKGQITKFTNYLSSLSACEELTHIQIAELNLKLGKFEGLAARFDDLQNRIEVLCPDNLSNEIDERDSIEDKIIMNIASAKSLIESNNKNEQEQRRLSLAADSQCCHDHHEQGFKLPQIQIAKFDGAYFRWLEFRDSFESLIHNNSRIKPVHKFQYLVSYLEGDAARIISNLEVSAANYAEAWQMICERYNNKRMLLNHHLSSLLNINVHSRESEKSLRYMVDHVTKNLRALANLGQPTEQWDLLLIFMLCPKLDSRTLIKWEEHRNTLDDVPTFEQFKRFLIDRADVLEALNRNKYTSDSSKPVTPPPRTVPSPQTPRTSTPTPQYVNKYERPSYIKSFPSTSQQTKSVSFKNQNKPLVHVCIICEENHKVYECPKFISKSIKERLADVATYKLCTNCLRQGHRANDCRGGPCRECNQRHNSLLHEPVSCNVNNAPVLSQSAIVNLSNAGRTVLLSTALIEVVNPVSKEAHTVRALLDSGSEMSFITKKCQEKLSLQTQPIDCLKVMGIGNTYTKNVVESCNVQINSLNSSFKVTLSCLILKELTSNIPKTIINIEGLKLPNNIKLADPHFNESAPIDLLIGADLFWDIIGSEQQSLGPNNPKMRNSVLGWLISGPINTFNLNRTIKCNHATIINSEENEVHKLLTKFWEIEEVPNKGILMNEKEKTCEKHFSAHTCQNEHGRYCVKLPLSLSPERLGDSYHLAGKRLLNLEKKFKRNPTLKTEYVKFMKEYADLGHMSESNERIPSPGYFLCHHAVFKENSESTSLRVVFDGSMPSSSGVALNDLLMVGPNVQDSLFSILVRARQYEYLLAGDIEKMYRQVLVNEEDRNLQLILWRESESRPIKTYQLNTLTYGTASASYLSTRCLAQIGEEQDDELIKNIIKRDFYIDDLITGSDNEHELRYIQKTVANELKARCFNLRKYKSNLPTLFDNSEINTSENLTLSESSSTLGLGWSPSDDVLTFPIKYLPNDNDRITKRFIMSNAFKIFDPLGMLSPCTIQPKMLLQKLWLQKIHWDQPVLQENKQEWLKFAENLTYIQQLKINRRVRCDSPKYVELHTFSDASQSALGACVYVRSVNDNDEITVRLLCSKSKVAPVKPTTMPRLELCAALLSTRLCKAVVDALRFKPDRIVRWSDSSIVLAWINNNNKQLKSFVANRISEIRETTNSADWRYVPTAANPADLISRGVDASRLQNLALWWTGPSFLSEEESGWPLLRTTPSVELPEIKACTTLVTQNILNFEDYSSLTKLERTFAFVRRFIFNLKNKTNKRIGILTCDELVESFNALCLLAQRQSFPDEYDTLVKGQTLSPKCKLLSLSPFLDDIQLIRVGGRIEASNYPFEKKHPILLHAKHHLTRLIFEREHMRKMHAGPQLLLASVRETVWPINGRQLARRTANRCVCCRRHRGKTLHPKMGNLPTQRIVPDFPFVSVGLDFAGPFYILNRKGRGSKLIKCYMCLFVCLRYKCVHLECVTDLTKDAFIMTLRRFVARRGKPAEVFCDNGRNFVAAAKELGDFLKQNNETISDFANQEGIRFFYSPAYAPHFGGIFEAGIKSAKHHLRRVIGNSNLTFEELSTLFTQVEAILNSRPLYPLSSSPNDFLSLTPGHFLIGRALTSLPNPALENHKESSLQRYARVEKIRQHFWQRWQKEYICELQHRCKWRNDTASLNVGDLVLLQEDHVPPLCWRLGRVARLFPGADGVSRVADINTVRGCVRRPLVRLCPLPTSEELQS